MVLARAAAPATMAAAAPAPPATGLLPGSRLYVTNQNPFSSTGAVTVLDTSNDQTLAVIPMGATPTDIALDPVRGYAYVTNQFSNEVIIVDTATNTRVGSITVARTPVDIELDASGSRAYVTNFNGLSSNDVRPGTVTIIDLDSLMVLDVIPVGAGPVGLALNPARDRLYVANSGGTVSVIPIAGPSSSMV